MRKIFTLLIVAILATATSWAATTGTIKFGTNDVKIDKASVTAADDQGNSWKITTVGTEYFGQQSQYTQVGSASAPATSITFTTKLSKGVKVSSLSAKFGGFKGTAGTIKLSVGSTEIGTGSLSETKDVTVTATSEASGTQLTVTVTNITKGVKCYNITYTYEDSAEPEKAVKSLAITGEPTNKEYYVGGKFNPAGLVVTATYEDESTAPVTPYVTWTFNPTEFTEVAENVEVAVKASYKGKDANTTAIVSVNKAPSKLFIDLDKDETTTATPEKIEWVKDLVTVTNTQGNGGTAANNYYPGKGTYKYTRFYSKSTLTFTPKEGFPISSIVYVAQSTNYATIMANSTWTNATAKVEGETVTISPKDGSKTISAKIGGTTGGHSFTILFGNETPKTLQSIAISGTPQTEYTEGETFSTDGLVVTATYDDASTAVVTDDATWSFEPATLAASTTSVTATATYNEKTASETYNVTVKEIPSYTYTWMVNGAEVKKSVLKAGAAVEAPANPENIADKVFTGWVTTATVDANVAPTYATIDATAKANTTYYAVFATLKQGAGEKWVKKTASEITEGGVYALITEDGKAFNGEISGSYRGDGQSTVTAFEFVNNEATSAPEGTCELTFEKSEKAETDGNEGYNMINKATGKFLTSMDNSQGNLTWSVLEDSYWYSNNGWIFKKNNTHLRVFFNSENIPTFRTYPSTSGTEMYFAQKVAGAGYADFTTIVKAAVTTLANLAENGAEGAAYQVNDEMVVAKKFQAGNKNYIVVKDAAQAVRNFSTPAGDKFFNINGNKQEEYTQNNWMLVSLPVELYNQVNEKNTVTSITGTLTEKTNVAMEATNVVFENATNDFAPNTYCPINFMGESSVKGTNQEYTSSYYFATPKANEYANVVWAVYNVTDGAFYLPVHQGSANAQEFKAAFKVDYSLNSVATPELVNGDMYSFEALVKEMAVATTDAKSAPRKTAYDSTVAPSTKFVVYPLDLDANKVATGVNDVNSAKEVKGVSYFNMMGVESAQPFDGVNIMVTTYTDGTQSAT